MATADDAPRQRRRSAVGELGELGEPMMEVVEDGAVADQLAFGLRVDVVTSGQPSRMGNPPR